MLDLFFQQWAIAIIINSLVLWIVRQIIKSDEELHKFSKEQSKGKSKATAIMIVIALSAIPIVNILFTILLFTIPDANKKKMENARGNNAKTTKTE